jgi:hypothetical protein
MDADRTASWTLSKAASGVIYSKFIGPTPLDELLKFIAALDALMPGSNARLVFDLRELGGYNSDTKEPMKAWILKRKLAIRELTVVVPKSGVILKMVTAAIALATGVKISIREDFAEAASFAAQ